MEARDIAAAAMTIVLVAAGVILAAIILNKFNEPFPLVQGSPQAAGGN